MDSLYYSTWFGILLSFCLTSWLVSLLRRFVFAPLSRVNLQLSWLTNTTGLDYDELDLQSLRNRQQQAPAGAARTNGKKANGVKGRTEGHTVGVRVCVCVCARLRVLVCANNNYLFFVFICETNQR